MNERIRELAVKAGYIVGELPLNTNEKIQLAGLEKFAELIVRECAELRELPEGTPLYIAPPQRKPLTDEVIADLWHQEGGFHYRFARALERAHGIEK